ncbi:TPA: hypothetical protein NHV36_005989 [Klebsiella michiganensis]|uniref:hypothetical protein n=1 Tax=Klebsiella michiganensis TaxID=1134687 RepID=UPI000D526EFF|nr:hypothetical protein [Klebsiella michiganensis]QLX18575.1 hypothetical protein HV230_28935 [Klebsiella oxytoca]MDU7883564.1 hypothetical protein [Klebsiella michiganensis]HCE8860660.1 hypothetical protein [Klebsiella michiganensis]HCE9046969.1 hypothetical protein [Klebsiella michiganensis]HCE9080987.1 hypothetical protein [Klebsiella michiganensis]
MTNDNDNIGFCEAELFGLADCYTSCPDRDESDLDADTLVKEVKSTHEKYHFIYIFPR